MKIMIVDDEPDLVEALTLGFKLQWEGCEVVAAGTGESALELFYAESPDVILLDIAMPGISGFEVLRRLREVSDVPVLMLTVKGEEMDKVKALEIGADDYITKPFGSLELLARIKAVLRRAEMTPPLRSLPTFSCGDLRIKFDTREVTFHGQLVKLTRTEYNLLFHLVRNAGHVLTPRALLSRAWSHDYPDAAGSLKVYIRRLREKIEDDPHHPKYIITEWGLGYRFVRSNQAPTQSDL